MAPIRVLDTYRREVELTEPRWRSIVDGHPEIAPNLARALMVMGEGVMSGLGRDKTEDAFYVFNIYPDTWIKVVVREDEGVLQVVTAFACENPR